MAKRSYPKTVVKRRWIKGLFWAGIFGCLFLSIIAIGRVGVLSATLEQEPEEVIETEEEEPNYALNEGAQSFARNFANEYFNWSKDSQDEREERLEDYLAIGLDPQAGLRYENMKWDSVLSDSQVWSVEETGEQSANITLRIHHSLSRMVEPSEEEIKKAEEDDKEPPKPQKEKGETYLKYFVVPVKSDGESYVVHQLPYFTSEPNKPDIEIEYNADGNSISDSDLEEEISLFLETFFKTYTEGSDQEIAYYTKGVDVETLNGILSFKEVEGLAIYLEGESYEVHADILMIETGSEAEMIYPFHMELIQEENRWLVVGFENNY